MLKLIVMGHKGFGCSTTIDRLQNGGFHLQKAAIVEVVTQGVGNGSPGTEDLAYFLVDGQVGITLTVAGLRVGQAGMTHHLSIHHFVFGGWQGGDGFCQHLEVGHQQAHLTGAGAGDFPAGLNIITQVKLSLEKIHGFFAQLINTQKELDLAAAIFNVGECQLAHQADGA